MSKQVVVIVPEDVPREMVIEALVARGVNLDTVDFMTPEEASHAFADTPVQWLELPNFENCDYTDRKHMEILAQMFTDSSMSFNPWKNLFTKPTPSIKTKHFRYGAVAY